MAQYKRRRKLLDAELQVGLPMQLLTWALVYAGGYTLVVFTPVFYQLGFGETGSEAHVDALAQLKDLTDVNFVALLMTAAIFMLHGISFTHRLAGPVYRFKQVCKDIAEGRYPERVKLRKNDHMKDLAEEFTEASRALREQARRLRRINAETQDAARAMLSAAGGENTDAADLVMIAHRVLASAERLDRTLPYVPEPQAARPELEPEPAADPAPEPAPAPATS